MKLISLVYVYYNMQHQLKTWPEHYKRIESGEKTFEVRKNDRGFQTGDWLELLEYDPKTNLFTGASLYKKITYILHGGNFGLDKDVVVMSIADSE